MDACARVKGPKPDSPSLPLYTYTGVGDRPIKDSSIQTGDQEKLDEGRPDSRVIQNKELSMYVQVQRLGMPVFQPSQLVFFVPPGTAVG